MTHLPARPVGLRDVRPLASIAMARRILTALGLLGATASAGACGGNVVVDSSRTETWGDGGAGGDGGGNSTTSSTPMVTTTATATPQPVCTLEPTFVPETICLPTSGGPASCPLNSDAWDELEDHLFATGADCGCCFIWDACGPDPVVLQETGQCCYEVQIDTDCGGRPYITDGEARTATIERRLDWLCDVSAPQTASLDSATRAALAARYQEAALFEHASVASFARFTLELLSLGAPADLVMGAQQAMGDEVRHAQLCFALAAAYGGAPCGPSALDVGGAPALRRTAAEIAASLAFEGCVNETVSALIAAAERDRATDPAVRAALDEIVADESAHAELAWRSLAWLLSTGDSSVREAARAVLEAPPRFVLRDVDVKGADPDALAAHGVLSAADRTAVADAAMRDVVLPCARALLTTLDRAARGAAPFHALWSPLHRVRREAAGS